MDGTGLQILLDVLSAPETWRLGWGIPETTIYQRLKGAQIQVHVTAVAYRFNRCYLHRSAFAMGCLSFDLMPSNIASSS